MAPVHDRPMEQGLREMTAHRTCQARPGRARLLVCWMQEEELDAAYSLFSFATPRAQQAPPAVARVCLASRDPSIVVTQAPGNASRAFTTNFVVHHLATRCTYTYRAVVLPEAVCARPGLHWPVTASSVLCWPYLRPNRYFTSDSEESAPVTTILGK
jgi:hypothetical protein